MFSKNSGRSYYPLGRGYGTLTPSFALRMAGAALSHILEFGQPVKHFAFGISLFYLWRFKGLPGLQLD